MDFLLMKAQLAYQIRYPSGPDQGVHSMVSSFTVPLTLLVAVPLYLRIRGQVSFLQCLGAGLVAGLIGVALFYLGTNPLAALNWGVSLVLAGLLSSVVFWLVAVWKNDQAPT